MFGHENLELKKKTKTSEDVLKTKLAISLDDGEAAQRHKSRELDETGRQKESTRTLANKLERLENTRKMRREDARVHAEAIRLNASKTKDAHTQQLSRALNELGEANRSRGLVTVPTNTALVRDLGNSFRDRIDPNERALKKLNKRSELYQKDRNARMIEVAEDNYARKCHSIMSASMAKRTVQCEDKKVFNDLAQFLGASDKELKKVDKSSLLDCYLGKSQKPGPEGLEGQDKQKAMDIMTKAIMAIDVSSIRLDSDAYLARNCEMLEGLSGKIAAYHRMLKRYGGSDAYFGSLEGNLPQIIRRQVDRLSLISYYYMVRRNIIKDKYFREHYNEEIALATDENSTPEQVALAKRLNESVALSGKLNAAFVENNAQRQSKLTEEQRQKLEEVITNANYLKAGNNEIYSSKAIRCDTTFDGLRLSFDELEENGRLFWANSSRMDIVKSHISEVKALMKKSIRDFNGQDARLELMYALSELKRACTEYRTDKITAKGRNKRHDSVLNILEYSDRCIDFLTYLSDEDFDKIVGGQYRKPLESILTESRMIADKDEIKMKNTKDAYFRELHYEKVQNAYFNNFGENSSFSAARAVLNEFNSYFEKPVSDNQEEFYSIKRDIERGCKLIIKYGKSYISSKSNYFSSSIKKQDRAGEVISYSEQMLRRIKDLKFSDLKTRNTENFKWSDLLFGGTLVTIRENEKTSPNRGYFRTFVKNDADEKKYRQIQAASFVLGDGSMLTNYRPSKLLRQDGSVVNGLSYTGPKNELVEHGQQVFQEMTANSIREAAESEGIRIIYSENALRQLANIRIMDTLFGRKTRNLDSINYNAATQIVFGEPMIVISSVLTTDPGYFGGQAADEAPGERVKNVSVIGQDGKLNIGAYDRKVADRIMSMSAADCFTEFAKIGINVTREEREAFERNLAALKSAFEADMKNQDGWRFKQDQKDEEKRQSDLKEAKNSLRKYRRWKVADTTSLVKTTRQKVKDLSLKKIRDPKDMYINNAAERLEKGLDAGLMDMRLVDRHIDVDMNLTMEQEVADQEEKNRQQLTGRAKILRDREFEARKKILRIRQDKNRFISNSDQKRLTVKNGIKTKAQGLKTNGALKGVSAEFIAIMDLMIKYAEMDVTVNGCLKADHETKTLFFDPGAYNEEANTFNNILKSIEKRLGQLPQEPVEESEKYEVRHLKNIRDSFIRKQNGKLNVPAGKKVLKVTDAEFVDIEVDATTNKIQKLKLEVFNDKKTVPLFPHEPCVNDISQGRLGDCYFLSTIASLVEKNPDIIKTMMKDNDDGTVTVSFYNGNEKIYVNVEKSVPKNLEDEKYNGDRYVNGALWVQMLEKAYVASGLAKKVKELETTTDKSEQDQLATIKELDSEMIVSYRTIRSGNAGNASEIFTGKTSRTVNIENDESFEDQLKKGRLEYTQQQIDFIEMARNLRPNSNYVLMASSVSEHSTGQNTGFDGTLRYRGVVTRHAYTVMGLRSIDGEDMIILRNPWGVGATREFYSKDTGKISTRYDSSYDNTGGYLFLPVDTFFRTFRRYHVGNV